MGDSSVFDRNNGIYCVHNISVFREGILDRIKRMHSSRMRTVRNSSHMAGGYLVPGGVPGPRGV